jgi:hypothetical protein
VPITSPRTVVTAKYVDATGNPIPGVVIMATLIGPTTTPDGSVERQVFTKSLTDGTWNLSLYPNSVFADDSTSYYLLRIGGKEEYFATVPVSANPVELSDILNGGDSPLIPTVGHITGGVQILGNVIIAGSLTVSGSITARSTTEHYALPNTTVPAWYHDLVITGDLITTEDVLVTGTITAGSISEGSGSV